MIEVEESKVTWKWFFAKSRVNFERLEITEENQDVKFQVPNFLFYKKFQIFQFLENHKEI